MQNITKYANISNKYNKCILAQFYLCKYFTRIHKLKSFFSHFMTILLPWTLGQTERLKKIITECCNLKKKFIFLPTFILIHCFIMETCFCTRKKIDFVLLQMFYFFRSLYPDSSCDFCWKHWLICLRGFRTIMKEELLHWLQRGVEIQLNLCPNLFLVAKNRNS